MSTGEADSVSSAAPAAEALPRSGRERISHRRLRTFRSFESRVFLLYYSGMFFQMAANNMQMQSVNALCERPGITRGQRVIDSLFCIRRPSHRCCHSIPKRVGTGGVIPVLIMQPRREIKLQRLQQWWQHCVVSSR